jgi:hypothetical protein
MVDMESPMGRDPQELNKNMLGGKKWWQYLCVVLAFLIAITFTLVFKDKMVSSLNGIMCAVIVMPLGYVGVFSKNGLDFFEYYRRMAANRRGDNVFLYVQYPLSKPSEIEDEGLELINLDNTDLDETDFDEPETKVLKKD